MATCGNEIDSEQNLDGSTAKNLKDQIAKSQRKKGKET